MDKETSGPNKPYMMLCRNEHTDAIAASITGPVDDKPFGKCLNVLQTVNHEIDE